MVVTEFFIGNFMAELLKILIVIFRKSCNSRGTAKELKTSVEQLLPIIQEIKYFGVGLPVERQFQLDRMSEVLQNDIELV
ncbi:hypothetical protein DVH24_006805 [Malus domestica]|uniref:RPW8 domain-containing protein n=1 Tax=Malus domestica TaxID=3750 RepID=A0A498J5U0_MALDO|nr:hypothetical protein DVH24_006805 [Malus domestica]